MRNSRSRPWVRIRATPVNAAPPAVRVGAAKAVRSGGKAPAVANPETITLSVTVQTVAGGTTLAVVDFTGCTPEQRPIWFANQDGDANFQVNSGISPNLYQFNVTLGRGAIAYVLQGTGGNTQLVIQGMSQAEWSAPGSRTFCAAPSVRSVTGTLAGFGATDLGHASLGNGNATVPFAVPGFTLNNVAAGTHDFVAYSHLLSGVAGTDRMGIRRDVVGAVTSVGTFNMLTDPDAFAPLNALITIGGPLVGTEVISHGMTYFTGASCTGGFLYFGMPVSGNTFNAYGAPLARQRPGDRHEVSVNVQNTATDFRTVQEWYHDFGPRTVTLPTRVSSVGVVEHIPGPGINYKRLRLGISRPADLRSSLVFQYSQAGAKALTWTMTAGWLGSEDFADIVVSDFHTRSGWNDAWLPSVASTVQWTASVTGNNLSSGICSQASGRQVSATVIGTH